MAAGGDIPALVESLKARHSREQVLVDALKELKDVPAMRDLRALERRVRARLEHWRELLTEDVQAGRGLLGQILVGHIQFTPVERDGQKGNSFRGEVALSMLLHGTVDCAMTMASPAGTSTSSIPDPSRLKGRAMRVA